MKSFTSLLVALSLTILLSVRTSAQTISDFENLSLPVDTFWNGSDYSGGFVSGNAHFPNLYLYDSLYGGYWASGFAYSTMRDSTTAGFLNLYSARPGIGASGSSTYALGQQGCILQLTGDAEGKVVNGVFLSNSTYNALSMRDGDGFAKKFGGSTGDDPDWFKVTIKGWYGGSLIQDSVEFYLADYRFTNNTQDYIVTDWQWVDLSSLGNVDSLVFSLTSSDNGMYGMNTPPFFCIDNFTTADSPQGLAEINRAQLSIFPNPTQSVLTINGPFTGQSVDVKIFDQVGNLVIGSVFNATSDIFLNVENLISGTYHILIFTEKGIQNATFIKL